MTNRRVTHPHTGKDNYDNQGKTDWKQNIHNTHKKTLENKKTTRSNQNTHRDMTVTLT